jgi:cathepsin B
MQKFVFVLCLAVVVLAVPTHKLNLLDESSPALKDEMINYINSLHTTWTAGRSGKFEGLSIREAKTFLGAKLGGQQAPRKVMYYDVNAVPDSFDARDAWPNCPSITLVRDQSACGSCWAFGSTEAFNDRTCIKTGRTTILSVTDVLGCCGFMCGEGCNGGYPTAAWEYFKRTGAVTDDCYPYPFPACAHHVNSTIYPPCPAKEYNSPKCNKTCADGTNFSSDKVFAASSFSIGSESDAMQEISTNGPITAAFTVYEDFLAYSSGVYYHVTGQELGGHAIEFVGYGEENGMKYWLVKNSWNPSWGDGGYFKIRRGTDECGIEDDVVAGMPSSK